VIEFLLQQENLNAKLTSTDYSTPLHYLARTNCTGKDEVFKTSLKKVILLMVERGVPLNMQDNKGDTCLHQATLRGSFEIVQVLLSTVNSKLKDTALEAFVKNMVAFGQKRNSSGKLVIYLANGDSYKLYISQYYQQSRRNSPSQCRQVRQ
jgi:ankyrin repeat protein